MAAIGFAMLAGRVDIRRGATVILGCFILFAAPSVAGACAGWAVADDPGMAAKSRDVTKRDRTGPDDFGAAVIEASKSSNLATGPNP